ncbi:MAG TPA: hypothetical protein VJS37_05590 [Terriglobales bacterium]|nr:hypothetical protein [Terriglobales bacterium]
MIALNTPQLAEGQTSSETSIRSRAQLLSTEAKISFPEKLVVTPSGLTYLLDTDLSTLFALRNKDGRIDRICGSEVLSAPGDMSVDRQGNIWVLSVVHSKIVKLTSSCQPQAQFVSHNMPLRIATNVSGELIVLNGVGEHLFELYGPDGKLLRGFGKRLEYKDETTNSELSDGRIAPDNSGGFFFSFNYPPLIRHYARNGTLISEFKPESEIPIDVPNISVRQQGSSTVVRARYQILVLDMAADARGRLFLLLSGKNKVPALTEGSSKLVVVNENGRVLKRAVLENNFHRLAISNGRLYLLRNRTPFRLDEYPLL